MQTTPFLIHALSPLHAGTGQAIDVIDVPTARMQATGIPFVPGSSIKGVLRDARRDHDADKRRAVFGPDTDHASDHAGALVVSDARLLALPVRSFRGTFAWVTSPLLLTLTKRDLVEASTRAKAASTELLVPSFDGRGAMVSEGSKCLHSGRVFLEDLDLPAKPGAKYMEPWTKLLAPYASPGDDIFTGRFVIVDDDTMTFLWETATQMDARVRLDESTRTAATGALWLEESLPPETLLIGLLAADRSRRKQVPMKPEEVLAFALDQEEVVQIGGKASVGRGRCRIVLLAGDQQKGGKAS